MMASTIGAATTVTIVFASVVVMFVTIVITVSYIRTKRQEDINM